MTQRHCLLYTMNILASAVSRTLIPMCVFTQTLIPMCFFTRTLLEINPPLDVELCTRDDWIQNSSKQCHKSWNVLPLSSIVSQVTIQFRLGRTLNQEDGGWTGKSCENWRYNDEVEEHWNYRRSYPCFNTMFNTYSSLLPVIDIMQNPLPLLVETF